MCGSDGLSSSSSLLICGKSCRCQAENPLNALPSFTRPALEERRPRQRPLSRLAPQARGLLDQAGLGAMARQQLRLAFRDLTELAFEGFDDAGVQRASRLA